VLKFDTPIETYKVKHKDVDVKRDDLLNGTLDLPPWAKLEGIRRLLASDYFTKDKPIVHLTVRGSYTGWALAYWGKELGYDIKIAYPKTKAYSQEMLKKIELYDGDLIPLRHNMVAILSSQTKNMARENDWQMNPDAFNHPVYINYWKERSKEFFSRNEYNTLVIQGGSGITSVGLIKGFLGVDYIAGAMFEPDFEGKKIVIVATSSVKTIEKALISNLGSVPSCLKIYKSEFDFYDEMDHFTTPFPCNKLWDKKAWEWITKNPYKLKGKTLFWNLGA
jgi:hypothetical protein